MRTYSIERFDVLLVYAPGFGERVPPVLVKDGRRRPLLGFSEAADKAARAMLS